MNLESENRQSRPNPRLPPDLAAYLRREPTPPAGAVYIGRSPDGRVPGAGPPGSPTPWSPGDPGWLGNPWPVGSCDDPLAQYRYWLTRRVEVDLRFRAALLDLAGRVLWCPCRGRLGACHGEILLEVIGDLQRDYSHAQARRADVVPDPESGQLA